MCIDQIVNVHSHFHTWIAVQGADEARNKVYKEVHRASTGVCNVAMRQERLCQGGLSLPGLKRVVKV